MSGKKQRAAQRQAKRRSEREVARRDAKTQARRTKQRAQPDRGPPSALTRSSSDDPALHVVESKSLPYLDYREYEREWGALDEIRLWRRKMPGFSTRAEIHALSDEALLAGLAQRGLSVTREQVLAHIEAMPIEGSAWTMTRRFWIPEASRTRELSVQDRQFFGLAAVELWRRWRPDLPMLEARLDAHADAEDRFLSGDYVGRVRGLLAFMRALRERLAGPGATFDSLGGEELPVSFWMYRLFTYTRDLGQTADTRELVQEVIAEGDRWIEHRSNDPEDSSESRAEAMGDLASLCERLELYEEAERRLRAGLAVNYDAGDLDLSLADLLEREPSTPARLAEAQALRDRAEQREF